MTNIIDKVAKLKSEWESIKASQQYGTAQSSVDVLYSKYGSATTYSKSGKSNYVYTNYTFTFNEPCYFFDVYEITFWVLNDDGTWNIADFTPYPWNESWGYGAFTLTSSSDQKTWYLYIEARYGGTGGGFDIESGIRFDTDIRVRANKEFFIYGTSRAEEGMF